MEQYLRSTDIADWHHPEVAGLARSLGGGTDLEVARRCFEWVRDEIRHSVDFQQNPVTCCASEVLAAGTGFCFAKSHLLAALLRANGIPTAFCYQRFRQDTAGLRYGLHGLNAVHLPDHGWYRIDARGNKRGVDAQFTPPVEQLAFAIQHVGEADFSDRWADPLPQVIAALHSHQSYAALAEDLPDLLPNAE